MFLSNNSDIFPSFFGYMNNIWILTYGHDINIKIWTWYEYWNLKVIKIRKYEDDMNTEWWTWHKYWKDKN